MICVNHKRCSSWPFVDKKKSFPRPFADRPNYDLAKVFFVALRGPSWTKKGLLRGPSRTDPIMILQWFSSWPFVALRGQKKVFSEALRGQTQFMTLQWFSSWPFVALRGQKKKSFPRPFADRPNYNLAMVFFVALRGPSWTKKGLLRGPSRTDPIMTLQWFSSWPFVALRGQKKVFSEALRG